jgi:predicted Zn-dependent protease
MQRGLKPEAVMVETLGGRTAEFIAKQAKKWRVDLITIGAARAAW